MTWLRKNRALALLAALDDALTIAKWLHDVGEDFAFMCSTLEHQQRIVNQWLDTHDED